MFRNAWNHYVAWVKEEFTPDFDQKYDPTFWLGREVRVVTVTLAFLCVVFGVPAFVLDYALHAPMWLLWLPGLITLVAFGGIIANFAMVVVLCLVAVAGAVVLTPFWWAYLAGRALYRYFRLAPQRELEHEERKGYSLG